MKPGTTIGDRYVIEALAGAGGMASVYKARDEQEGRSVAIKLLHGRSARRDERFARESKLLCELRHPAIVRYFTTGITPNQERFLVMEWLEGEDLAARIRRDPLSIAETLTLIARIAPALAFIHARRVVHRDVKPANIFLPNGSTAAAKLLDFGVARWGGADNTLTQPGTRQGTPAYMSPEQARGVGYLNARSDVFSLGCVLYECLTGQAAFAAQDAMAVFCKIIMEEPPAVRDLVPNVPDLLAAMIDRMLVKQPAQRPKCQEIAQLARHLQRSLSNTMLQQRPISRTDYPAITESEQRIVHVIVAASSPELLHKSRAPARWLDWLRDQMSPQLNDTAQTSTLLDGQSDTQGTFDTPSTSYLHALEELARGEMPPSSLAQGSDTSWTSTSQIDRVRHRLELIGARCNTLADGSMLAVLEDQFANSAITSATAVDQAANAARCALSLAHALPDAQIAVASGKAVAYERRLLGKVIDQAIALLRQPRPGDTPAPWRGGEIHTDLLTTVLLGQRFEVDGDRERGFLLRQERHDVARAQPSTLSPFVGRSRELRALNNHLDACIEDELASAVVVTGPAGFGKSRLCREFLDRLAERNDSSNDSSNDSIEVWLAHADPMRSCSALYVIGDAVRSMAGIVGNQSPALCRHLLRDRIARHVDRDQVERITAFLGELLHLPPPLRDHGSDTQVQVQLAAARRDPKLMAQQIRRACIDLFIAETAAHPVLVVIEDFHWIDRASLELLDRAQHTLQERPFMILAAGRLNPQKLLSARWAQHSVTQISLGALRSREAEKMARAALGNDVTDHQINEIIGHANGNPFYLEELIRNAVAGNWDLPDTVVAMVQGRLATLDPQARQVLRAASIFGDLFWLDGVSRLVGDNQSTEDWLKYLIDDELIVPSPTSRYAGQRELTFRNTLIREVAYQTLPDKDKQSGHRRAAAWLAKAGETHARVIADHYDKGGAPQRAMPHYVRAAEQALEGNDLDTAVDLAQRAAASGASGALLGRIHAVEVEEHIWRGSPDRVAELGRKAMELLPKGSYSWYRVAAETAIAAGKIGQTEQTEALAAELSGPLPDGGAPIGRLIALAKLSLPLLVTGRRNQADKLVDEIQAALKSGDAAPGIADPILAANIHLSRAIRESTAPSSDPTVVLQELERCAARFEEAGDLRESCLHLCNVGHAKIEIGLNREAETDLRASLRMAEQMSLEYVANLARMNLGQVLARLGSLERARDLEGQAIAWFATGEDTRALATSKIILTSVLLALDNLDEAENEARSALQLLPSSSPLYPTALACLARAQLLRDQGKKALANATRAMELLAGSGSMEGDETAVELIFAEALYARDQRDEARAIIARAHEQLLQHAEKIGRDEWRRSFLEDVPDHARIRYLAAHWSS